MKRPCERLHGPSGECSSSSMPPAHRARCSRGSRCRRPGRVAARVRLRSKLEGAATSGMSIMCFVGSGRRGSTGQKERFRSGISPTLNHHFVITTEPLKSRSDAAAAPERGPNRRQAWQPCRSTQSSAKSACATACRASDTILPTERKKEWIRDALRRRPARDRGRLVRAAAAAAAAGRHGRGAGLCQDAARPVRFGAGAQPEGRRARARPACRPDAAAAVRQPRAQPGEPAQDARRGGRRTRPHPRRPRCRRLARR